MGTSGILGFIIDGKRHATYDHYDSYPAGLGQAVVAFILSLKPEEVDEMARSLGESKWVNGEDPVPKDINENYCALGYNKFLNDDWSKKGWYGLLRAVQGLLLRMPSRTVISSIWLSQAFFIDSENRVLEVWDKEFLDKVSFENLRELGWNYMKRVQDMREIDCDEKEF